MFETPSKKKDLLLPKIEDSLKGELMMKQHELRHVEVKEKRVLPTADDVNREKIHRILLQGIENFSSNNLKRIKTREPPSGAQVMQMEIAHQTSLKEVKEFKKTNLKRVEVEEKNPLPDTENIKLEAEHKNFLEEIEHFKKEILSKTQTIEKNTLPTQEIIQQEKAA